MDKPSTEPKPLNPATLAPPAELTALVPDHAASGGGQIMLELIGSGFTMFSQVYFDDAAQATNMMGPDRLMTLINPSLYNPGTINISVVNGEHHTAPLPFTLTQPEQTGETGNAEDQG